MPFRSTRTSKFAGRRRVVNVKRMPRRRKVPRGKGKYMVRQIKQIVRSITEKKQAYTTTGNSLLMFNSGIDSIADCTQIMPSIAQSIYDNGRIGDQVRGVSLNIRGYVKLNINDTSDSTKLPNVAVRMMILSMKNKPTWTDVTSTATPLNTLLKKGGTTTAFTGVLSDLHAPINRDVYTVHHDKKFYLRQDFINAIGASVPSQYVAQDVSRTVKFFNLRVPCKKLLRYDEDVASGLYPVNFAPFLVLGYVYLDGTSSPDVVATNVGLSFDSMFTYTDA